MEEQFDFGLVEVAAGPKAHLGWRSETTGPGSGWSKKSARRPATRWMRGSLGPDSGPGSGGIIKARWTLEKNGLEMSSRLPPPT